MSITITGTDSVNKLIADLNGITPLVTRGAINKTLTKGKTLVSRRIKDEINLKASYIKSKLSVKKATVTNLIGVISAEKRGILLSRFSARRLTKKAKSDKRFLKGYGALADSRVTFKAIEAGKKQKAISYQVKTGGGRKTDKFFPIRLKYGDEAGQGAVGLAVRTGSRQDSYKILHGPSVSQVFNSLKPDLEAELSEEYLMQFDSQLEWRLSKL